ncbi:MAG TPA: acetate--CoA ligase family protein, partial [Rhodocyclaceae bacterium]|nr:acetate--CoA ligase family protein [Rhodocyclaceae bacterium]
SEYEAKTLLHAFGLPVAETVIASSRDQAVAAAEKLGFPVVIKIHSPDITHKSDVGGVRLDLQNSAMVATAFDDMLAHVRELKPQARIVGVTVQPMLRFDEAREVLIGVATDPLFGPVISFGAGGVAVEVLHDIAVALPPLDSALADDLIRRTRINNLLQHYRNVPAADLAGLSGLLVRISELLSVLPWISEMDLNPVLVHPGGVAVVDARIVIDSKSIPY